MLQEGRDINGEDKTHTWGEGVRQWGHRHSIYFTSHSFPTLHTTWPLPFLSYTLASRSWAGQSPASCLTLFGAQVQGQGEPQTVLELPRMAASSICPSPS